jgi:adenosine deaminase
VDDRLRALPKVLLHEHLDGSLRVATLLDLLRRRNLPCPAADAAALGRWFDDRAHAGSLVEYLRGFDLTVAAMATPQALERVAFEAAEDARADGSLAGHAMRFEQQRRDAELGGDAAFCPAA